MDLQQAIAKRETIRSALIEEREAMSRAIEDVDRRLAQVDEELEKLRTAAALIGDEDEQPDAEIAVEPEPEVKVVSLQAPFRAKQEPEAPKPLPDSVKRLRVLYKTVAEINLATMERTRRSAHVAYWAGLARQMVDEVPQNYQQELTEFFGILTRYTREHACFWVEALSQGWRMDDLDSYVTYYHAMAEGREPNLSFQQFRNVYEGRLKSLLHNYRASQLSDPQIAKDIKTVLRGALKYLPRSNYQLKRAMDAFGAVLNDAADPDPEPAEAEPEDPQEDLEPENGYDVDPEVLAITRGKTAIMTGGQGTREDQRRNIEEAFEFASLEWETHPKRRGDTQMARVAARIENHKYDFVIVLAAFTSHKASDKVTTACKSSGIPVVFLNRGYNPTAVEHAIIEQLLQRRRSAEA